MCIFLFWSDDAIFSNLMKNTWKILNSKKVEREKFLATLILFFAQKLLIIVFYKWFLCTNYIFMFIMKRSISTRGFKNSTSKL